MLMVAEMTGGYALLPPLMLVSVLSILLSRGRSIYDNQVKDRFSSPAHLADLTINVLEEMRVADVYRESGAIASVEPGTRFERVREMVLGSDDATVPVVDANGRLVGLLTAEQIRPVLDEHQLDSFIVAGDIAAAPWCCFEMTTRSRARAVPRLGLPADPRRPRAAPKTRSGRIVGMLTTAT
jgi:CIC family chloride channel protein